MLKTFNILKKNRKYFAATIGGYKCKIHIDDSIELGEQALEVEDLSVRSKYGTDLIFKLIQSAGPEKICTLRSAYNNKLVEKCRAFGGNWDADSHAWIFSSLIEKEIEELDEKYNSKLIAVEVKIFGEYAAQSAICVAGFPVAKAFDRDSGAKITAGVAVIAGNFSSGGSAKNWATCSTDDCVIRMQIPQDCLCDIELEFKVI